jgi:hypothetical protein
MVNEFDANEKEYVLDSFMLLNQHLLLCRFLEKVENGEIVYNEDDFGLCMYEDGVFDPNAIDEGLFQSLFLVLVRVHTTFLQVLIAQLQCWKCIFLGKQAAANHGKKNVKGKGGTAAKHDLGKVTKRTIAYAAVQASCFLLFSLALIYL